MSAAVTFYGVRGSIPAPGPETVRYGGNTSCVALRVGEDLLILDSGTGITRLGRELMAGPFGRGAGVAAILLSHAHWDHIQGFPFFPPIFVPGNRFSVFPGERVGQGQVEMRGVVARFTRNALLERGNGCGIVLRIESFEAFGLPVLVRGRGPGLKQESGNQGARPHSLDLTA